MYGFVYTTCLGECMFKSEIQTRIFRKQLQQSRLFFLQYSIDTRWNILVDIND